MAQIDSPFGLVPVGMIDGSPWNGKVHIYYTTSTIFKGSAVIIGGTGDTLGQARSCAVGSTEGNDILGVAWSFGNTRYLAADVTDLEKVYNAGVAGSVGVIDDPRVIFMVQEDNASSATLAITNIGQNAILASGMESGDTTTGLSSAELSSAGTATTASSYPLRLHGIVDRPDNVLGSLYCKWLVTINNHSLGGRAVGI